MTRLRSAAFFLCLAVAPVVPTASTYLALEKGWFAQAGFDVKIEELDSATKLIPFLANGQMQVVHGGLRAVYFSAIAQGLPITLALDSVSSPVNQDLLVRPDLKDAIKKVADLKARNVAFVAPAGVPVYSVGMLPQTAPPEKLADRSYAEAAAAELGPFKVINTSSTLEGCR